MDIQKDFNVTALLEEDSWNMFQEIAGNVVNEVSIKPIAEEVAKCCAGLPLLITAVSPHVSSIGRNSAADKPGDFHREAAANCALGPVRARRKAEFAATPSAKAANHDSLQN